MPKLSLAKLERHLYGAADRLRQEGLGAATLVRMLKPQPGLSIYDPTCDSGGMLIISREFVEQSGGDPTNLRLCGQVNDPSAWSLCKLNMLLHDVPFRGGAEKEIRRKFLEQDLIEAVIGLPQNLFYGAGIPACILVMRPNLTSQWPNPGKPAERRGQVLFINADAEFYSGRAQNYLKPEHVEKIASTFERCEDVPGYARRVTLAEIGGPENDWNLNIRRYVDNSPPREPHDVRAHLLGGVPAAEVEAKRPLCEALGFDPAHAFVAREPLAPPGERGRGAGAYLDFAPALTDRAAIRPLIENDPGVKARAQALRDALAAWWDEHSPRLADLPEHRQLNRVRSEFLDTFAAALLPLGTLDRFKLAGVIATWWTDTLPDFKTLLENGFPGVIDGWVDAIADAVEDDEAAGPAFDPFGHKLVRRAMADYLEQIADAKADIARLKGEKEAFEQANAPEDLDEEEVESWNQAKDLARRIKEFKAENREALKRVGWAIGPRGPSSTSRGRIAHPCYNDREG